MVYWQETIHSEQVGGSEVTVQCDKCDCEYFFLLTRIGRGAATAPFRLATGSAARIAGQRSERDLDRRLDVEAELVPCPKCHWINDELVRGYRLTRFRRLGSTAIVIGIIGVSISLITSWFISIGPPGDRRALPYVLIGGPAIFIGIAIGLLALRWALRRRIAPNRDFPHEPRLPPGTPKAMLRDAATGRLTPARTSVDAVNSSMISFQIGRDKLPPVCCQCLAETQRDQGFQCSATATITIVIPQCEPCRKAESRRRQRIMAVSMAIGIAVTLATLLPFGSDFWLLVVLLTLVVIACSAYLADRIVAPAKARKVDAERGVVQLWFRNPEYGRVVVQTLNADAPPDERVTRRTRDG